MKGRKSFGNVLTVSCAACGVSVVVGMREVLHLTLIPPLPPSCLTWLGTLMLLGGSEVPPTFY